MQDTEGIKMKRSNRITLTMTVLLTALTLSFQHCAPARFASEELASTEKIDGVDGSGDGVHVTDGDLNAGDHRYDRKSNRCERKRGHHHIENLHNDKKVAICHKPPGRPDLERTLCVGEAAAEAHVRLHGDTLGACQSDLDGSADDKGDADHDHGDESF